MIHLGTEENIENFKKSQKSRILAVYGVKPNENTAEALVKAEFDEKYPVDKYEIYSIQSLDKFRQDITKSETIEDKDAFFKSAVQDLKPILVYNNGKRELLCVKKKV